MLGETARIMFWPFIISFLTSFSVSWLMVKYGKQLKIIDDPKRHKHPKVVHDRPVPRGGGVPIFAAILLATAWFLPLDKKIIGIISAAAILAWTGWVDDRYEEKVSPYLRLLINVLAALAIIGVGIGIAYITNPFGGILYLDQPRWCFEFLGSGHCVWLLADLFAVVWLVWTQNVVGWSSGVDGQLSGFVIVAAITIAAMGLKMGADGNQITVIVLAMIIAGAYGGFWPWNWYPQKIMPGYGGKSLAGLMLGVLAIMSGAKVGAMLLVLGVPFADAILVIFKRIREGRSPVWGGREHLHHILLDLGWSKPKIATAYFLVSGFLAVLALQLKAGVKYFTMATIALLIIGGIWWLQAFWTLLKQHDPDNG